MNFNSKAYVGKSTTETKMANYWNDTKNGLLTGFTIYWNNYLTGIQPIYGTTSSSAITGSVQNQWQEKFLIESGDYIVEVFGRAGDLIDCLGFKTAKGLTKVWGNPLGGDAFSYSIPSNYLKSFRIGVASHMCYFEPIFESVLFMKAVDGQVSKEYLSTETVGQPKHDTIPFSDKQFAENIFNFSLAGVTVTHDGNTVHGLAVSYNMDGTVKSPGKYVPQGSLGKSETFQLSQGEHIVKLLVNGSDAAILGLGFFTDKGRMEYIGSNTVGNVVKTFTCPEKYQFISFSGGVGKSLHWIQAHFLEIE